MMRLACVVQYNGSQFHGWQKQPGQRTVQSELELILCKMHHHEVSVHGSGRTDRGVHALGQVFHFDSELNLSEEQWVRALNSLTPDDIHIKSCRLVSADFHARYNALGKWYRYVLNTGDYDVFHKDIVYQYGRDLDLDVMKEVARNFIGRHDFFSFNACRREEIEDQVRTLSEFQIAQKNDLIIFDLKGDGFLRYMVRMLTGCCIQTAEGKLSFEMIQNALVNPDKTALSVNLDSCGLTLMAVYYPDQFLFVNTK